MDVVALGVWGLVALLAMPLALGTLSGVPALGLQPVAAIGGLTLTILYVVLDGPSWAGWVAFGLAWLGIIVDSIGVSVLCDDRRPASTPGVQAAEELEAGLLGAQLPLFGVAMAVSAAMGVQLAVVATSG
jgi:hypothetical protein